MSRLKERIRQVEARKMALQQASQRVEIRMIVICSAENGAVLETWQDKGAGWKYDGGTRCS